MKKGGAGFASMGGLMLAPMAGQALADNNPTIEMFDAIQNMQAAGKDLTAQMYAEFVHTATENSKGLDLSKSPAEARQKLMEAYANARTPVAEVIHDMVSGKMESKIAELEKQVVAAKEAAPKVAVGKHTEKVLEGRGGAAVNHSAPVANDDAKLAGSELHATDVGPKSKVSHVTAERLVAATTQAVGGAA